MALSVSKETIKRKCRILNNEFDEEIEETIAEQLPVIEYAILPVHLADLALENTLNLGAAEVIAGEFLAQLWREPGSWERIDFGDFSIGSRDVSDIADPFGLKKQGYWRLAPFMKPSAPHKRATRTSVKAPANEGSEKC